MCYANSLCAAKMRGSRRSLALSTSNWEGSVIDGDHRQAKTMTEEIAVFIHPNDVRNKAKTS